MSLISFWLFGFRAGWWEGREIPFSADLTGDRLNRAYYAGYRVGSDLSRSLRGS